MYSFAKWRQQHLVQRKVIICAKGLAHNTHTPASLDPPTLLGWYKSWVSFSFRNPMWTHSIQMNNFKGNMMLTLQRAQKRPRGQCSKHRTHMLWAGNQVSRERLISCHLSPCPSSSSVILLLYEVPVFVHCNYVFTWRLPPGSAWKLSPLLASRIDTITNNGCFRGDVSPLAS